MYGTIGHLHLKPNQIDNLKQFLQNLESRPGVLALSLVAKDGNTSDYYWTIVWVDKVAHDANNSRPEAPAEYQQLLGMLAGDPSWHSGEIVYGMQTQQRIYD